MDRYSPALDRSSSPTLPEDLRTPASLLRTSPRSIDNAPMTLVMLRKGSDCHMGCNVWFTAVVWIA